MDKLHEESRKQFEEAYSKAKHFIHNEDWAWEFWQASRSSIVVDTPQLCGDGENDSEYTDGYNDGVTATEKTILSIGLSIKGD